MPALEKNLHRIRPSTNLECPSGETDILYFLQEPKDPEYYSTPIDTEIWRKLKLPRICAQRDLERKSVVPPLGNWQKRQCKTRDLTRPLQLTRFAKSRL